MRSLHEFRPRAVIFDLDGTLADNMAWHAKAFDVFLGRRGREGLSIEWRRRIDGKRNSEIFPMLFAREMPRDEIKALEDEKEGLYRSLSSGGLVAMAGADALLDRLQALEIPVAVATSAPPANVEHTMRETGLDRRITVVARGDQVPRGKPAPDVFLHAAALLGVPAGECLAFEDAPVGVAAATAAGMPCDAVTSSFAAQMFEEADVRPDATVRDFEEFLQTIGSWMDVVYSR